MVIGILNFEPKICRVIIYFRHLFWKLFHLLLKLPKPETGLFILVNDFYDFYYSSYGNLLQNLYKSDHWSFAMKYDKHTAPHTWQCGVSI